MKRSDASEAMRFLGYDAVPADVPGIKAYNAKTKRRMFEIGRLIFVARKAGKEEATSLVNE